MKEYKEIKIKKEILIKKSCDRCGKTENIQEHIGEITSIETCKIEFGYASKLDGNIYELDICDDCFLEIIKEFKHKPKTSKYI
jgi:hypothetical protein